MGFLNELLQRPPITWWDALDILIVSILVYELLKLIRGTRAVQMAIGIAAIVAEVTDDKSLPKAERKRLQVEHAAAISPGAKLVKLADKICNLRDVAERPPAGWDLERRREYFDWAKRVIDGLRGAHPALESAFDAAYLRKP